jgi:hypothetical protein
MKEIVKLIILSHKRAGNVDTLSIVSNCSLCVPESQANDYSRFYPDVELIIHPDSVKGLSAKVKWVYERYPNCVQLDDDLNACRRTFVDKTFDEGFAVKDKDLVYDIIQSTAFTAKELGCVYFGFSNTARPLDYSPMKPYYLTGHGVGGSHGFFEGYKMVLPDDCVSGVDYFLSASNAYFHRNCFINRRYAFTSKEGTFESTGGMADFRTTETEKKDYYLLKSYFGNAIQKKKVTNMRKTMQSNYEKVLRIPF